MEETRQIREMSNEKAERPALTLKDGDTNVLSSGREFYAHNGIVGLGPEPTDEPTEGYDGRIATAGDYEGADAWTAAECAELADVMIARWQAWKARRL